MSSKVNSASVVLQTKIDRVLDVDERVRQQARSIIEREDTILNTQREILSALTKLGGVVDDFDRK